MDFTSVRVKDHDAVKFAEEAALVSFMPPIESQWLDEMLIAKASEELREVFVSCVDEGLGGYKRTTRFSDHLHPIVGRGRPFYEMLSSVMTTRARLFSRIRGYQKAGIKEYEIDAIIDNQSLEVDELMDGKVFEVSQASRVANQLLGLNKTEDIRNAVRWMSPMEVKNADTRELVGSGFIVPPFHDSCRARLQAR